MVRRYRCRACAAIVTVVPPGVTHRRHFGAGAIAIALFVFGKLRASAAVTAERIGGWGRGSGAWRTLRRWLDAVELGRLFPRIYRSISARGAPRERAANTARVIAALVPEMFAATELGRVFAGAARAG